MTEAVSIVSGVAQRYASALFELAVDAKALDAVSGQLDRMAALLAESPDLTRLVRSPVFTGDEQARAVGAVMERAGIDGLAANFIRLVAKNRRLFALSDMITSFRQQLAAHRGEMPAEVVSAEPLKPEHVEALKAALKSVTGGKDVRFDAKVDPSLIGGLIVKVGSRMIDTSLKSKLASLKVALKEVR